MTNEQYAIESNAVGSPLMEPGKVYHLPDVTVELGEAVYRAYMDHLGWRKLDGSSFDDWDTLPNLVQGAFRRAGLEAIEFFVSYPGHIRIEIP